MKKVLLAILGVAMLVGCQPKSYEITGTLEGATSEKVFLNKIRQGKPVPVDTVEMVEGVFKFSGSVEAPEFFFLIVDGKQQPGFLFAENAKINITGDVENLSEMKVTGPELSELFVAYNEGVPGQERMKELQQEYQMAYMSQDQDKIKILQEELQSIQEDGQAYASKFIDENTDNALGLFLAFSKIAQSGPDKYEESKALAEKFRPTMSEHVYFKEIEDAIKSIEKHMKSMEELELAKANVVEGKIAPDFTLPSNDGKEVSLSTFKGKYVLIDFWASWCKPCRAENPNVVKAYQAFNAKGFEVISISVDQDKAAWAKAIQDDGLTWTQLIADEASGVAQKYAIQNIPSTFLLDKEGKIIAKNLRGAALEEKLAELFN